MHNSTQSTPSSKLNFMPVVAEEQEEQGRVQEEWRTSV